MASVRSYALQLLEETGTLSLPVNLDAIAEAKDIVIKEQDVKGYSGMLLVDEDVALISIKKSIKEESRKRFTIAHEYGHFSIPGHITKDKTIYKCTDKDVNSFGEKTTKEIEANYFAAELLMPEDFFMKRIELSDLSKKLLKELSDEFKTSFTATSIRFVSLRTEYALVLSENSRIKWFHRGENFPLFMNTAPGSVLHEDSYAFDFFKGNNLPESFNKVSSNAWIDDYKIKDHHIVRELSIGSSHYNQVLSFLYIESLEDDEYDDDDDYYRELDGFPRFR